VEAQLLEPNQVCLVAALLAEVKTLLEAVLSEAVSLILEADLSVQTKIDSKILTTTLTEKEVPLSLVQ